MYEYLEYFVFTSYFQDMHTVK